MVSVSGRKAAEGNDDMFGGEWVDMARYGCRFPARVPGLSPSHKQATIWQEGSDERGGGLVERGWTQQILRRRCNLKQPWGGRGDEEGRAVTLERKALSSGRGSLPATQAPTRWKWTGGELGGPATPATGQVGQLQWQARPPTGRRSNCASFTSAPLRR